MADLTIGQFLKGAPNLRIKSLVMDAGAQSWLLAPIEAAFTEDSATELVL